MPGEHSKNVSLSTYLGLFHLAPQPEWVASSGKGGRIGPPNNPTPFRSTSASRLPQLYPENTSPAIHPQGRRSRERPHVPCCCYLSALRGTALPPHLRGRWREVSFPGKEAAELSQLRPSLAQVGPVFLSLTWSLYLYTHTCGSFNICAPQLLSRPQSNPLGF